MKIYKIFFFFFKSNKLSLLLQLELIDLQNDSILKEKKKVGNSKNIFLFKTKLSMNSVLFQKYLFI